MFSDVTSGFTPTKWKRLKFIQDAQIQRSGYEIAGTLRAEIMGHKSKLNVGKR
jgi:hypothetical protein